MHLDMEQLEREAELGRRALAWINLVELRREEDRQRYAQVKRVARELAVGFERAKAAGQAA